MKKLLSALLLIFGAFIGLIVLMGALAFLVPEWTNSTGGLLFMHGFQTIVLFGVTAVVGVWFTEKRVNPFKQMSLNVGLSLKQGVIVLFFAVAALPVISMLAEWNKGMELPQFLASLMTSAQTPSPQHMVLAGQQLLPQQVSSLSQHRPGPQTFSVSSQRYSHRVVDSHPFEISPSQL